MSSVGGYQNQEKMRIKMLIILITIYLLGCQSCKSLKIPKHEKTYNYNEFFLPPSAFLKVDYDQDRDTNIAIFYSELLTSFQEPNLYKYKGESSVFRLTLDRTFRNHISCLLYTSPSPRDATLSRMPSSA